MLISILIINYNVAEEVVDCIVSIKKNFINVDYEIIVVDNCSTERKIEELIQIFPGVHFHLLKENLGFAGANNFAAEYAKGKYLLFLNPDTLVIEDFITPIINYIEKHQNMGACGPLLLNEDRTIQNSTGIKLGIIYEASEAFMLINLLRRIYNYLLSKKIKKTTPVAVRWLSAACLMVNKDTFIKIGKFNKEFFLNYEDIDLCERIAMKGYNNFYFPYLRCIHADQKSQSKNYTKFVYNRYYGRRIYAKFHYNFFKRNLINLIHIFGIILRILTGNFTYTGVEREQRIEGYKKSLKLYLS